MFWCFLHKWVYFDKDDNPVVYPDGSYRDQGIDYKICDRCKSLEHLIVYDYCGQGDEGSTIWVSHKAYIWDLAHGEISHSEKNMVKFKAEIDAVKSPRIPTIPYEECFKEKFYSDYCYEKCVKYSNCLSLLRCIQVKNQPVKKGRMYNELP